MTFVAAIPYGLASKGCGALPEHLARLRSPAARRGRKTTRWPHGRRASRAKSLLGCLLASLKIELVLSEKEPEEGQAVHGPRETSRGTPPEGELLALEDIRRGSLSRAGRGRRSP